MFFFEVAENASCIFDGGQEQLISNGKRFKPAFAEIDKKQTVIRKSPRNFVNLV
jgi:hypothetical protein